MSRRDSGNGHPLAGIPNGSLTVIEGNKSWWTHADQRRYGFHNMPRIARYGLTFRSAQVLSLRKNHDLRIPQREDVRLYTSLPWFSAMVVVRGQDVLFERYAQDFGPHCLHSIQSITKTFINLIVGALVESGSIELDKPVKHYVPEIGSGYAKATVQQVLNMDVVNEYSEDFSDPAATYYAHEEAMGWRLPRHPGREQTQRSFLPGIRSADTTNPAGVVQYKDANTDVLGWVVERASQRPLRSFLADIVDAAGLEDELYISVDREGTPSLDGGACLSARDLARLFALFVRNGLGVNGQTVGSKAFIAQTLSSGIPMSAPSQHIRYSNHLMVHDQTVGHGGWGGQFALANLSTGAIGVFFSVLETEHAITADYRGPIEAMLFDIAQQVQ